MIIPCFRCGKKIDTPNASNADYIIADDTKINEEVDVLELIQLTKEGKKMKAAKLVIPEQELIRTEVADRNEASCFSDVERIEAVKRMKPTQKTAIICPKCHKRKDEVIWGVHKVKDNEQNKTTKSYNSYP